MCDLCWRGSHDGLVTSGFAFSTFALIYAIAVMILFWVVHQVEDEPTLPGKCEQLPSHCVFVQKLS